MARYFYAFRWAYGIGTTWDDGSWPGSLRVFDSRAERDAWVADDVFDGNWHCEATTAPDVYLEVQHPCWSCNSNSSSANASAGVR